MRNKKGQALVEFVIILPVMIILIFSVIDFGRVVSSNSDLENVTTDCVTLYENGKEKDEISRIINENRKNKVDIDIFSDSDYTTITVSYEIKPITPGLNYLSKKIFNVSSSRVIKNE